MTATLIEFMPLKAFEKVHNYHFDRVHAIEGFWRELEDNHFDMDHIIRA